MTHDGQTSELFAEEIPASVIEDMQRTLREDPDSFNLDDDSDGRTLFDTPQSEDGSVIVVFPQERFSQWRTQALAHIESHEGKTYLAQVLRGPFAEPNGLPANSPLLRVTQVERTMFTPPYHGWVTMSILAEVKDGNLLVPLYRPRPNSRVRLLTLEETREALRCEGDIHIGQAVGFNELNVGLLSDNKHHIPRHTLVVGTTGAGKSTFMSSFIEELAEAGFCVLIIDVEPEYAEIHLPAESKHIKAVLKDRGIEPGGIPNTFLLVPTDCEAACARHPRLRRFSLDFSNVSPFLATELLQANDAQRDRFLVAYDAAGQLITELMPKNRLEAHRKALREWDDQQSGYPDLKLGHALDMAETICAMVGGEDSIDPMYLHDDGFRPDASRLTEKAKQIKGKRKNDHAGSWRKTVGLMASLYRTKLFDRESVGSGSPSRRSFRSTCPTSCLRFATTVY